MLGGHGVNVHSGVATAPGGAAAGGLGSAPAGGMAHMMGPPGHGAAGPGGMMSHGGNNGNSMGHNMGANSNPNANQSNNRAPPPTMGSNGFHSTPLGELRPNMKNVNLELIILHYVGDRRIAQDNQLLTTFIAADSTGCVELVIWGEDSRLLKAGDLLRVHSADTKLFKGKMQVTTTRHGKYKKFGEDILLFKENPNFSEFEWVQDPSHPHGVFSPLTNQLRMDFANRGIQPVPVGQMGPQRGMAGQQGSFNPSFRQGPPRQFQGNNPNNMPPQGMGGAGMHKTGGQGFQGNNNSGNNINPKNGFGFHNQGPDHLPGQDGPHPQGQHDNMPHPQHHHPQQQQQQQQHQGPSPPQGGHLPQHPRGHRNFHNPPGMHGNRPFNSHGPPPNVNQGGHGGGGGDGGNASGGSAGGGGGGRVGGGGRAKFNKSKHRDLDAPTEAYPNSRSGLANSNDDFNRDISKLMNQGNVGLGMLPGGGGPGGPAHMRKKPKIESD
ncbi:SOSS complex subunit B2 [Actinomortierella ambigua]|nr:SOSS complex subunit B2 [Actinomortierella ambigua]